MTFVIDIDGTLINSSFSDSEGYKVTSVDYDEINKIKKLYNDGHTIIIHTARRWDIYNITIKQLEDYNIKYHQLVMGKPSGVYVDKDSVKTIGEYFE